MTPYPAAVSAVLDSLAYPGTMSPLLMREVRACSRAYPTHAPRIRYALDRMQGSAVAKAAPVAAYDEYKPHALWSAREIAAWQRDYPEYQWDVWCVVCGVA